MVSALVGIVNLTPDSFSDGGQLKTLDQVLNLVRRLIAEGSSVIDVGAESTRPGAVKLTAKQEKQRLEAVLPEMVALVHESPGIKLSLDSYHPETIAWAIGLGVDWINDVSGVSDSKVLELLTASTVDIVAMHHLTIPADKSITLPQDGRHIDRVYEWAEQKIQQLEASGIDRKRIIIDPGIGFGKTAEQSMDLINAMSQFKGLGARLLVGHSRKSFLQLFGEGDRDLQTLAVSRRLEAAGVDYLRVHNVSLHQEM